MPPPTLNSEEPVFLYTVFMMTIESFRTHRHSRANIVDDPNVFRSDEATASGCMMTALQPPGKSGVSSISHDCMHLSTKPNNT